MQDKWKELVERLALLYPGNAASLCELNFVGPFQLAVATILSAQCTDQVVNSVSEVLFRHFPDAQSLAAADPVRVEELVRRTGFFRNKAQNIILFSQEVIDRFDGQVPDSIDQLVGLSGVGRKTANVIVTVGFSKAGIAVDTHVIRLSRRLGLTEFTDPAKIEMDLMSWLDPEEAAAFGLRLILHGRRICTAKKPKCQICSLGDICPSFGTFGTKKDQG